MTPVKPPPVKKLATDLDDPAAVLTIGDMNAIGHLLGKNLRTKEDLVRAISALTAISVDGISITLEPGLLQRLKSRCLRKDAFPQWLSDTIKDCLHGFVGW